MKKIIRNKKISFGAITLLMIAIVSSVLIYACKKPTDGINILVDSQLLSPGATLVSFQNADSTSTNQPGDFAVNVTGPDAAKVQMISGGTAFQASHGFLSISLVKGTNPTVTTPVSFTVSATVPGFAPFVQNIVLTNTDPALYIVKAQDYSTSGAGTALLSKSVGLTAGSVTSGTTFSTTTGANLTETATINFPAGTKVKDASGNVIPASSIAANIIQLSDANNALSDGLPGGLYAPNAIPLGGGAPISGGVNFVPAGALLISMTAGGTPIKSFSSPITATIELASGITNFDTGLPVAVGDQIPVWSQDDQTGIWTYEGNAPVFLDSNNKLAANMAISHLSNWMLAWFFTTTAIPGAKVTTCAGSTLTTTILTDDPGFKGTSYTLYLQTNGSRVIATRRVSELKNGSTITFTNLPVLPKTGTARILVKYQGKYVYASPFVSLCGTSSLGLTIATAPIKPPTPVNVYVNISGICNGKQVTILPTAVLPLYQVSGNLVQMVGTINVVNGIATTTLNTGTTYSIATYYNKTYYSTGNFVVNKAPLTFNATAGFNLTSTYDASTNTVNLLGTIPVDCK